MVVSTNFHKTSCYDIHLENQVDRVDSRSRLVPLNVSLLENLKTVCEMN